MITFERDPARYRHWRLEIDPPVATVTMAVDADAPREGSYSLKLNSYDLDVDIELYDLVQRLRFEHPEVRSVLVTGGLDRVFCAGANIQMLAGSTHHQKVNFCKFTNETRNSIEDATDNSRQVWIAAVNGTAAGGGYELALACDEIVLVDDRSSSVSLPEVPLLGVLPGTGGLTRVVDKRKVRRDLADVFTTKPEGVRGQQALDWGLVDSISPPTRFAEHCHERARARAAQSDRPLDARGIRLPPLERATDASGSTIRYRHVEVAIDRDARAATITVHAPAVEQAIPGATQGSGEDALVVAGADWWALVACRELDDAALHLRVHEPEIGTWVLRTQGEHDAVLAVDDVLREQHDHWLAREIRLYWKRTLKRLELSARTLVALVEPGSCFVGTLLELALLADRSFMFDGTFEDSDVPPAAIVVTDANFGWYPMANGLSRLEARFWGHPDALARVGEHVGKDLLAPAAAALGLMTSTPDDLDWDDEVRLMLEERASLSPDALTGMEANYRFVGPETIETKIFGRLSAWQNWIFQRPNAAGPDGALRRYGSGSRPTFDWTRT